MGHISSVTVSFIYMTLTLASLTAFQSCGSGHYMTTDIRSDLSAERIIYSNADSSWMTGDRKKILSSSRQERTGRQGQSQPLSTKIFMEKPGQ